MTIGDKLDGGTIIGHHFEQEKGKVIVDSYIVEKEGGLVVYDNLNENKGDDEFRIDVSVENCDVEEIIEFIEEFRKEFHNEFKDAKTFWKHLYKAIKNNF